VKGDRTILEHAATNGFVLISTDTDFRGLAADVPNAKVVILRSCNYPTGVAAEILRRNAIRIGALPGSTDKLVVLDP
jgi:predicted nuclease of predicted toxin-antitoxin system